MASPSGVLLTQPAHYRSTDDFIERYDATVWAPPKAEWRRRPNPSTTDDLPQGIQAIELEGEPNQVLFLISKHSTLVTGDVLTGRDGVMHVFVDEADRDPLLASLDRIAELPIERVIVPHSESPVFSNGSAHHPGRGNGSPTELAPGSGVIPEHWPSRVSRTPERVRSIALRMPEVFGHDVLTCLFCDQPVEDERFRCEVIVRPEWQPAVEMQYVCHIECLRKAAHPTRRIGI